MALDQGVVDSVVNSNFKALAEQVATNTIAHQHRLQILAEKALANSLMSMDTTNVDVSEGIGTQAAASAGIAGQMNALAASVAALQQYIKAAQTTPPVTP